MKKGSYIVNTARGKICDRDAITRALVANGYFADRAALTAALAADMKGTAAAKFTGDADWNVLGQFLRMSLSEHQAVKHSGKAPRPEFPPCRWRHAWYSHSSPAKPTDASIRSWPRWGQTSPVWSVPL